MKREKCRENSISSIDLFFPYFLEIYILWERNFFFQLFFQIHVPGYTNFFFFNYFFRFMYPGTRNLQIEKWQFHVPGYMNLKKIIFALESCSIHQKLRFENPK
jgi:hypothetical protein